MQTPHRSYRKKHRKCHKVAPEMKIKTPEIVQNKPKADVEDSDEEDTDGEELIKELVYAINEREMVGD